MTNFNVLLFEKTAPLDVFGPIQVIGVLEKNYTINYYSEKGEELEIHQNLKIRTLPIEEMSKSGILFIPGGYGIRLEVNNTKLIKILTEKALKADFVLTVCTGTALLAKTGLIDNIKATTNKMAYDWVTEQNKNVKWIKKARWVKDGKYYSSSGVAAGIDMILGFISDVLGIETAKKIAEGIEYIWNKNSENDPFCK